MIATLPQPDYLPMPTEPSTTSRAGARSGHRGGWFERDYEEYGYTSGGGAAHRARARLPRIEQRLGRLNPPAARAHPILIGGGGVKRTLKLVADTRTSGTLGEADVFREKSAILDEHCAAEGRDPAAIER